MKRFSPFCAGESNLAAEADNVRPGVAIAYAIEGEVGRGSSQVRRRRVRKRKRPRQQKPQLGIKVVYVADIDLMLPVFFQVRADPNQTTDFRFQFQNVTFLLNTIDWLTGETDFIDVRKHEPIFAQFAND